MKLMHNSCVKKQCPEINCNNHTAAWQKKKRRFLIN